VGPPDRDAAETRQAAMKRRGERRRKKKKRKAEQKRASAFGDVSSGVAGRTTVIEDDDEGPRTSRRGAQGRDRAETVRGTADDKRRGPLDRVTAFTESRRASASIAAFRRGTLRISASAFRRAEGNKSPRSVIPKSSPYKNSPTACERAVT